MKKATHIAPALFALSLIFLGSCGSSPEAPEAPPEELAAVEEAPSPEVQALEKQLAQMTAALEDATVEPEEEIPVTAAEEVADLYLDPSEVFPVEIVDGVPMQMAMVVEESTSEEAEVPEAAIEAEETPAEVSDVVVAAAEPVEPESDEPESDEPLEITEADLIAMAQSLASPMFEDPGYIAPEPESEPEAEVDSSVELDGSTELAAEVVEGTEEAEAAEVAEDAMEDVVAVADDSEPTSDPEVAPEEEIAVALSADAVQAAIAESIASALESADSPEPATEVALEASEPVVEEDEVAVAAPWVEPIIWEHPSEPEEFVPDAAVETPVENTDETPEGELVAAAESLQIETVEDPSTAAALDASAASNLAEVFAFTSDLDPSTRLLLGPLCLADPSGMLARTSLSLVELVDTASELAAGPPEDPALVGLTRSDGAEFDPVPLEEAKLKDEPGLGMIWWGSDVPVEQVASSVEVQTPSCGRVRIILNSGDYVEGILHSVGKGQYWIDGDLGRFAVRAGLVSHVEHLPKPGLGQEVAGLQAGDLVRAKAKNGYIEGRLISMKDGEALIETAAGMRITLPDAEVEPLGKSKTRVVID
jgi:hypothetical protein